MMYVFTLMAMSFFATKFHFDDDGYLIEDGDAKWCPGGFEDESCIPRANFDTFLWSFVTIFQILSGENWNTVMYDGMKSSGWPAALFFLLLIVVGQCIILNLFLAILMAKFEESSTAIQAQEEERTAQEKERELEREKR